MNAIATFDCNFIMITDLKLHERSDW